MPSLCNRSQSSRGWLGSQAPQIPVTSPSAAQSGAPSPYTAARPRQAIASGTTGSRWPPTGQTPGLLGYKTGAWFTAESFQLALRCLGHNLHRRHPSGVPIRKGHVAAAKVAREPPLKWAAGKELLALFNGEPTVVAVGFRWVKQAAGTAP